MPISTFLIAAYRATDYVIALPDGPLTVHIGRFNPTLAAWMQAHCAKTGAYITAWNPYSRPTNDSENAAANDQLLRCIRHAGLSHFPCSGQDPGGQWPAEPGFWILGADRRWLNRIGRRYGQNAIVLASQRAKPGLVRLR